MLIERVKFRTRNPDGTFDSHKAPFRQLFDRSVVRTDTCWLWIGAKQGGGYGTTRYRGRQMTAHRASYIEFCGLIPVGLLVLHKCDVRHCVNPQHLFLGTHADNAQDCVAKGRHPRARAKLTDSQVLELCAQKSTGVSAKDLAKRFALSIRHVYAIASGTGRRRRITDVSH